MFKELTIIKFRSHEKTKLKFVPGINAIIGDPQSGKTNIIRAIKKIAYNKPIGTKWRSRFSKKKDPVSIKIKTTDKQTIKYRHKSGKATYRVNGEKQSGFNKDVPKEVTEALNLNELNIQEQIDAPFLVTESAGKIAKTINRIIKTDLGDNLQKSLTKKINKSKTKIKVLEQDISDLKTKKKKFYGLGKVNTKIKEATKAERLYISSFKKMQAIQELLIDIEEVTKQINKIKSALPAEDMLKKAKKLDEHNLVEKENLLFNFIHMKSMVSDAVPYIDRVESVIQEIEELTQTTQLQTYKKERLTAYILLKKEHKDASTRTIDKKKEYIKVLKRKKQCPTCKEQLTPKKLKQITGRL